MDSLPSYVSYIGIGVAAVLGLIVMIWIIVAARIFITTKGLPKEINNFFALIVEDKIDEVYKKTTDNFKANLPKKKFIRLIRNNKFKQFKRTIMSMPVVEGDRETIGITLILKSGREIPLEMTFAKEGKAWKLDDLRKK